MLPPQLVCWHTGIQLSLLAFHVGFIFPEIFQRQSPFSVLWFHQSQCSWGNWAAGEKQPVTGEPAQSTQLLLMSGFQEFYLHWGDLQSYAYVFVVKRWIRFKDSLQMGKWWGMIFWLMSCAIGNELRNSLLPLSLSFPELPDTFYVYTLFRDMKAFLPSNSCWSLLLWTSAKFYSVYQTS